ncbi:MAG: helix-turn-helix transcriptional regulator [Alphaproteobacteria bacterium]|nr:helix-turn-helix transcriptional regulator [Alphaproteobacteria bacterium]
MISAAQIRAGRSLLNVKQSELAKAAGVSLATLNNIERGVGDPRASTLEAIERALFGAGVEVESDGATETVRLHRLARPSAYETFHASQRILECLSRDSLLKVEGILFYPRRDHAIRDGAEAVKLCLMLIGRVRTVLFDQVSFTMASGPRTAETAGILLAAFALHAPNLTFIDRIVEDTTLAPLSEAVERLRDAEWRPLDHPQSLIDIFDDWESKCERFGDRAGHPLADLVRLTGRSIATPALGTPA